MGDFVDSMRRRWRYARMGIKITLIEPAITVVVRLATSPYYRQYHFNTYGPIETIAALANESQESSGLVRILSLWRSRKLTELQFISISCAILAAAVIGAFSWTTIEEAHWLTHGFWHGSLILAILGILLSASSITVLHLLGPLPSPNTPSAERRRTAVRRYEPLLLSKMPNEWRARKKMVFVWQCPLMFMSYSVCGFLAGLTILVCTPLIRRDGDWNAGCNIAVMYLVVCAIAGGTFVFCTFWIYHYVDMKFDARPEPNYQEEASSTAMEVWPRSERNMSMLESTIRLGSRESLR